MPQTSPRIFELRISLIHTETFPSLLDGSAGQAPLAFLGNKDGYYEEYESIKQRMTELAKQKNTQNDVLPQSHDPHNLTLPWPPWVSPKYQHHFWQYYFENTQPNRLKSDKVWEYVVPFRTPIPVQIGSPPLQGGSKCRVMVDGFFYPHGLAVILTTRLLFKQRTDVEDAKPGLGPLLMMKRSFAVRNKETFPTKLPDGTQDLKLDMLAAKLLDYLREQALGKDAPQGNQLEPITIATVIQGADADPQVPIMLNGDVHRVLEGLCSWRDDWAKQSNLQPLTEANLLIGNPPLGHIVYHLRRGRAVWMPLHFISPTGPSMHKLGCYHRNLTLVSLQTEMLAQANVLYKGYLDRSETPPSSLQSLARFAAIRLGFLYSTQIKAGKKYTYNSASPRFYLEENGYVDIINDVRLSFTPSQLSRLDYKRH